MGFASRRAVIISRRDFVAAGAAGLLSLATRSRLSRLHLRIGIVAGSPVDPRAEGALRGIALGLGEATRTVGLFGHSVEAVRDAATAWRRPELQVADLAARGCEVVVDASDDAGARDVASRFTARSPMVVHLLATPELVPRREGSLFVAPPSSARAEAVLAAVHAGPSAPRRFHLVADDATLASSARRIDQVVSARLGRTPVLQPGGSRDDPIALATHDPAQAEAAIAGSADVRLVLDLFGVTDRLSRPTGAPRVVRADAWRPDLERFGAAQLIDRYRARFGADADMMPSAWAGWFAVKALAESMLRARAVAAAAVRETLLGSRFDGHKGSPLSFTADGVLAQPLYVVGLPDTP